MSARQWFTPGRVITGLLSVGGVVAALAVSSGTERAQSMGATRHGQMLVARDAGAADVVGLATVDPPTAPNQVLTADDAGLPVWRAAGTLPTAGLDTARPAASLGAVFTGTDTGVRYFGESDGSGGTRWVVSGARGAEGRDTTAVQTAATVYGTSSVSVDSSTVVSFAVVFAMRSAPVDTQILITLDDASPGGQGLLDIGRDAGDRYLLGCFRGGTWTQAKAFTGATLSASPTTLHCIAVTFSGSIDRYTLDGAAVATVDHGAGSATHATLPFRIAATGTASNVADAWIVSAVLWSTAVGDSDLVTVSGSARAAGATPGRIPAVSGATEILRWHASSERTGVTTSAALGGSLGGSLTWSAAPTLVVR